MRIDNEHDIGEVVYLITDPDQLKRLVTGIMIKPNNVLVYQLSCGGEDPTDHYEMEISKVKEL